MVALARLSKLQHLESDPDIKEWLSKQSEQCWAEFRRMRAESSIDIIKSTYQDAIDKLYFLMRVDPAEGCGALVEAVHRMVSVKP